MINKNGCYRFSSGDDQTWCFMIVINIDGFTAPLIQDPIFPDIFQNFISDPADSLLGGGVLWDRRSRQYLWLVVEAPLKNNELINQTSRNGENKTCYLQPAIVGSPP